jgi:hypothetical protein
MLTAGDDYPLHQRPEPIAFAGTDRNFYDRYFFNGQSADGQIFFAAALGVYPHLNIIDGAFCLLNGVRQRSVLASRILHHERMRTEVGPLAVTVDEPLRRLSLSLSETQGLAASLSCEGAHPPIEEPRFTRRIAGRTLMDVTRMTQNVRWEGELRVDGARIDVSGFRGTRDRSWGVRPIGAADAQPLAPTMPPQFFWLWAPIQFEAFSFYAHSNDDADGVPWNRSAVLVENGTGKERRLLDPRFTLSFQPGSRWATSATIEAMLPGEGPLRVDLAADGRFQMSGIGYGHPTRGHGVFQGEESVVSEQVETAAVAPGLPANAHIQAIVQARMTLPDGTEDQGRGVLEQLVIGPHAPSGFRELFDLA